MDEMSRKILFPRAAIQKRVQELAGQISGDYAGHELVVIGIL